MNPTETFRRRVERDRLQTDLTPLPTTFRKTYTFSFSYELTVLLTALNKHVNVSREAEKVVKPWAAKLARNINKRMKNDVDS